MGRKPSPDVFCSEELQRLLNSLDPAHKFNKWIDDMKATLKWNMFAGDSIPKRQIPSYYVEQYGVNALYHYPHPEGYRSCYVLLKYEGIGVCPLIVDLMTHDEYTTRFGYKKS